MKFWSLRLSRIQPHADTIINFHLGVNVFIGETDSGKTAIIRCIEWILANRPSGAGLITYGQKSGFGALELDNNKTIIRGRKHKENYYSLIEGGVRRDYKAFGASIPYDIIRAHNVRKVTLDDNNDMFLNLANQHDPPFLLTDSGGIKAKAIGKLNGAYIVDTAIQDVNKDILTDSNEKKTILNRLEEIDKNIEEYRDLDSLREIIELASTYISDISNIENMKYLLNKCRIILNDMQGLIDYHDKILQKSANVIEALSVVEELICNKDQLGRLTALNKECEYIDEQIHRKEFTLYKMTNLVKVAGPVVEYLNKVQANKILLKGYEEELFNLDSNIAVHEKVVDNYRNVNKAIDIALDLHVLHTTRNALADYANAVANVNVDILRYEKHVEAVRLAIDNLSKTYADMLKGMSICPFCEQEITSDKGQQLLF